MTGTNESTAASLPAPGPHWRRISDEPLINLLHRRAVEIALLAYGLAVVYLSFVPFDFIAPRDVRARFAGLFGLQLGPVNGPDILANMSIYAPLGLLLAIALRRRNVRGLWCYPIVAAAAFCLSTGIEHAQYFFASRVSSWIDVVANVLGAAVGTASAGFAEVLLNRPASSDRDAAAQRWSMAVAKTAVIAVVVIHLRPYDIAVDVLHTAAQTVRAADASPLAAWNAMPDQIADDVLHFRRSGTHELTRVRQEYVLDRIVDVAVYAALFVIVAVALRQSRLKSHACFGWAGCTVVSAAAVVTGSRILLVSHGLDTAHLLCALAAVPLGMFGTRVVDRRAHRLADLNSGLLDSRRIWAMWRPAALACVVTVLAYELVPFDMFRVSGTIGPAINWTPFRAHFQSKPNIALYDISGDVLRYALLAASLDVFLHGRSSRAWRARLFLSVAAASGIAMFVELVHASMPSRIADVTSVVLAAVGGAIGVVALRWITDARRTYFVSDIDDPLTAALIDGMTYRPLPFTDRRQPHADVSQTDRARSDSLDVGAL